MLSLEMQVDNMRDHVTISPEKFLKTQGQGSLTSQHHIAIPIEELTASLEAASIKSPVTDANTNIEKPEEQAEQTEDMGECRYCHEEDFVSKLETPCSCNGSLKPYYPNYPLPEPPSDDDTDISEEWTISGTNTRIQSPLLVAEHATNRLIASMNKDFSLRNPSGGVIFGTALLIFVAVLVINDAYNNAPPKEDKFSHALYCLQRSCQEKKKASILL
ncbi:hypothetical protein VNO77_21244 [Canavalia gladiata]|uniref:RING-CH-type domain-containing protein n=1 Tax=Canavalia gladiata TaxID=3824 RepID=A0AAN9LVT2_CANGL